MKFNNILFAGAGMLLFCCVYLLINRQKSYLETQTSTVSAPAAQQSPVTKLMPVVEGELVSTVAY